jgi:hypothetical protein
LLQLFNYHWLNLKEVENFYKFNFQFKKCQAYDVYYCYLLLLKQNQNNYYLLQNFFFLLQIAFNHYHDINFITVRDFNLNVAILNINFMCKNLFHLRIIQETIDIFHDLIYLSNHCCMIQFFHRILHFQNLINITTYEH